MPRKVVTPVLYAATLLQQYRVKELPSTMRTCEKTIVHVHARTYPEALRKAEALGRKLQHRYKNSEGNTVCFEFVAVTDLIDMSHVKRGEPEVWYDIVKLRQPMERRAELAIQLNENGWPKRTTNRQNALSR